MPQRPDFDLMPFIYELRRQCSWGVRAYDELAAAEAAGADEMDVYYAVQNLLVSAGIVSRILWPSRDKHEARGVKLRDLLSVPAGSALKDRSLRDALEHMDERIETWREEDGIIHIDMNVGPVISEQALAGMSQDFSAVLNGSESTRSSA